MTDIVDGDHIATPKKGNIASGGKITPIINDISTDDISAAMSAALRDIQHNAPYSLFFGAFYALAGWILLWLMASYNLPYLVYPLATGFALIAPFIAAGLYEVSRRNEEGLPLSAGAVFGSLFSPHSKELRWMALVTGFAFIIWIDMAIFLYVIFFGLQVIEISDLLSTILTTPQGALFLVVGNLVGAVLGLAVFSTTAISFPMLLHKDVDFVTGIITSIQCVLKNPKTMISWAIFIAFMLAISLASFFVGMILILPLLGHATWHLYRRAISYEA